MDIIVFGLGVERVSPLQGFSLSIDVSTMILRRKVRRICPMQGFSLSIDVNTMILLSVLFYDFFAWVGVALAGLIYVISPNQLLGYFHGLALVCPQAGAYRVSYYSYLCKDLILGML